MRAVLRALEPIAADAERMKRVMEFIVQKRQKEESCESYFLS